MGAQPHSDVPSLGFDVGESDWPGIFPRFKRDVANILKPLALRAQESSECLGGHSKFNTEMLVSHMAKQLYGRSSHMGEVAIRRSNTLMDLVCGPGLAFPFFPPSSVRPWIQEYRWVHLPLPQVSPMGAVRTLSFSVLFLPSRSSPTSHPPTRSPLSPS